MFMGFSRQEYLSVLPCPPPRDLPDPGIKFTTPVSPVLQADSSPMSHLGSLLCMDHIKNVQCGETRWADQL